MSIRKNVISLLPTQTKPLLRRVRTRAFVLPAYLYDLRRFLRSSSAVSAPSDREQLAALVTMDYHRLEKGMSLPNPRRGFGRDVIERLLENLPRYQQQHGEDSIYETVVKVISDYRAFSGNDTPLIDQVDLLLAGADTGTSKSSGGLLHFDRNAFFAFETPIAFLRSRRSIRNYTAEKLSEEVILRAVATAQHAPSVCNRQSARVYVSNDPEIIGRVLKHQNGNRGFGHTLGAVFIVAADNRSFCNLGERNQMWVDGGIFAMSLVLSLHSEKVGACMLNWSAEPAADRRLRSEVGILEHHSIITMIGAGIPTEEFAVAASPRRPLADAIQWIS